MKERDILGVFILPLLTFGIYGLVWFLKTGREMRSLGAVIPTAWLLLIPLVNLYWVWKWSKGVEKVTNNHFSPVAAFVLLVLLGPIGAAIVQSHFNRVG